MNRRHLVVGVSAGALFLAAALSAAQAALEFELVSVRRSPPVAAATGAPAAGTSGTRPGLVVLPDGRFEARGQTLENLARVAFGFEDAPARGRNAYWLSNDRFDITASAGHPWPPPPPGTTVPAELRTMLRALLEDRFALKARIEMKKVDVTALRLAKPERLGPGLRPSAAECRGPFTDASPDEAPPRPRCPFTNNREGIQAEAVTMAEAVRLITQLPTMELHRPLVDGTGLPGLYDLSFSVPWKEGRLRMDTVPLELETQLGLRLQGTSIPRPTLFIERASKPRED